MTRPCANLVSRIASADDAAMRHGPGVSVRWAGTTRYFIYSGTLLAVGFAIFGMKETTTIPNKQWQDKGTIKMMVYNCCSALGDRMQDIAEETASIDIIILIGTRCRAYSEAVVSYAITRNKKHKLLSWGWRKGAYSNRSAGVAVILGPCLSTATMRIMEPPTSAAGRVAAMRVKTKTKDLLLIPVHLPPKGMPEQERQDCVMEILKFIDKVIQQSPKRTIPIIAGPRGGDQQRDEEMIGPHGHGREYEVSNLIEEWAAIRDMAVANAFWNMAPIFYASDGQHSSYIDHILIPTTSFGLFRSCYTSMSPMKKIQSAPVQRPLDHAPILVSMFVDLCHTSNHGRAARWTLTKSCRHSPTGRARRTSSTDLKRTAKASTRPRGATPSATSLRMRP